MYELVPRPSSSPAHRLGGSGLDARRQDRALARDRQAVRHQGVLAKDKADVRAGHIDHAKHRLAEAVNTTNYLAGDDHGLAQAMTELDVCFIHGVIYDHSQLFRG